MRGDAVAVHATDDAYPADLLEVAEGVYAYAQADGGWWVNTTGFVVTPARERRGDAGAGPGAAAGVDVVAIDACASRGRTRLLLQVVQEVAAAPVRRLVNTHSHPDHTFGNELFTDAAVLAHERCREELSRDTLLENPPPLWEPVPDWGDVSLRLPDITFTDTLQLWSGDRRLVVEHVGVPAHTGGDTVVWLPAERVLFTGDLVFNGGTPLLVSGSVTGYLHALQRLRDYDAEVLVPGHGLPCGPEVLDRLEGYARLVLDIARSAAAQGLSPLQAARDADLDEFADLREPERLVANLHRAYADLGVTTGVDVPTAFADTAALHGGPLPSSL